MTREEANTLVESAIAKLILQDKQLLTLDVTERALSFKLAHYLSLSDLVRPPLSVDCEYNRHFQNPKRLTLPPRRALDRELRATTVFPDIVVHQRDSCEHNFVVLELKKPDEDTNYDELKLQAFRQELGYHHAAHIILGIGRNGCIVRQVNWIED